ncbi:hypothetical protein M885DRAFT_611452 [Pelagophyceae sp. CCMP2097]|nr:hypothetical protein M885DRAFT_611452 [Pelagophyceae sp. CCMP2097]|mmetsp:Transcript_3805/g.11617  ORF Transcript_3805/g.11617 Transcript_3805/m.11617 type:complete len:398 (-) Transcript_3805:36-1229(-)
MRRQLEELALALWGLRSAAPEAAASDRGAWLGRCADVPLSDDDGGNIGDDNNGALPRRAAVLFWGEAFRNSRKRGDRGRCDPRRQQVWDAQLVAYGGHVRLFDALGAMGYGVDVFGVTSPCSDGAARFEAAAVLGHWYSAWLKAPLLVLAGDDVNMATRKRIAAVEAMERYEETHAVAYSHVLMLRWDLGVTAENFLECFLASGTLLDSRHGRLGNSTDWDRALLVPRRFLKRWACLLKADVPWLEPRSTCTGGGSTVDLEAGVASKTTCVCGDAYVGRSPDKDSCWARQCALDVCLSAFPAAARTLPRECQLQRDGIFAGGGVVMGEKIARGKGLWALKMALATLLLDRHTFPTKWGQVRYRLDYQVAPYRNLTGTRGFAVYATARTAKTKPAAVS